MLRRENSYLYRRRWEDGERALGLEGGDEERGLRRGKRGT